MERNNGQTIFLSVIGIATLLVAIIGATFAYFSTTISGTNGSVNVTTGHIGSVTYTAAGVTDTKILPGWDSSPKEVSVNYTQSDYPVNWSCEMDLTSGIANKADLTLTVVKTAGTEMTTTYGTAKGVETGKFTIANGTLAGGASTTFTYDLHYRESGENQNNDQDKSITATVSCKLDGGEVYYNTNATGGTTSVSSY